MIAASRQVTDSSPQLSVVVCTYNRASLIGFCLQHLVEQTLDKSRYEVLVIDNNCTDNTREVVLPFTRTYGNFRMITESNQGLSHARNAGYAHAKGEFVAFIDDDAKAVPEWAERILTAFLTVEPQPVAIGGETLPWCEVPPAEWLGENFEYATWGDEARFLNEKESGGGFYGMNMAFQRSALHAVNGFATNLGVIGDKLRLGEETELFHKLCKLGCGDRFWYDPAIRVEHYLPKEKMTFMYVVRRCFASGKATAQMEQCTAVSFVNVVLFINLFFLLLKAPWAIVKPGQTMMRNSALYCQKFASRLGRLAGGILPD